MAKTCSECDPTDSFGQALKENRQLHTDIAELKVEIEQVKAAAWKLRLCFPDEGPDGLPEFDIPRYIIDELDAVLTVTAQEKDDG